MTTPRRTPHTRTGTTAPQAPRAQSAPADSPRTNPRNKTSRRRNPQLSDEFIALVTQFVGMRFANAAPNAPNTDAPNTNAPRATSPKPVAPQPNSRQTKSSPTKSTPAKPAPSNLGPANLQPTEPTPAQSAASPDIDAVVPASPVRQLAGAIAAELGRAYYAYVALADRLLRNPNNSDAAAGNGTYHNGTYHNDTYHNDTYHNDTYHNDTHHNVAPASASVLLALLDAEAHDATTDDIAPANVNAANNNTAPLPGLTVGELGRRTRLASSTLGGLLARMERNRLIKRKRPADNKRYTYVSLTAQARTLAPKLRTTDQHLAELTAAALEPNLEQAHQLLTHLTTTYRTAAQQLPPRPAPTDTPSPSPITTLLEPTDEEIQQLLATLRAQRTEDKQLATEEGYAPED